VTVTWTEVGRHVRSTVTVAVNGAPPYEYAQTSSQAVVQPEFVTLWTTGGELTRLGFQGTQVKGTGVRDGGQIAVVFYLDSAPQWLLDLARDVL
jgi:hypothetical protein